MVFINRRDKFTEDLNAMKRIRVTNLDQATKVLAETNRLNERVLYYVREANRRARIFAPNKIEMTNPDDTIEVTPSKKTMPGNNIIANNKPLAIQQDTVTPVKEEEKDDFPYQKQEAADPEQANKIKAEMISAERDTLNEELDQVNKEIEELTVLIDETSDSEVKKELQKKRLPLFSKRSRLLKKIGE